MIENLRHELLELAHAIAGVANDHNTHVILRRIEEAERKILMKTNELEGQLNTLKAQVDKSKTEVLKRIADLEGALANTDLPDAAVTALDALKASVQSVDDINPDAPAGTP